MNTMKQQARLACLDPDEYTHWSDRTSMTRANIGRAAVDMLPYWNPDEDYDEDPRNINPLACMNLALIAIDGQEIGNALEEGAATKDGVLIVGALAVAGWQVSHFRERVAPQLKALRDYHPEWLVEGAYRQDGQVDWAPDADASFGALCTQLMDAAKEAYAGYKSEDEARFRRAFKLIEKQCELLPELLKERLETYYYHRFDTYQFPDAFAAAFAQLYEPATAEAEAAEVSAYN
ncbi:MAG: hypothetical protein ABMA26_00515 [Limisphaerales bacterium]